jgi:hypothetical protein
MQSACETADEGTEHIVDFLYSLPMTVNVENVEDSEEFRKKDIDLIWSFKVNDSILKKYIEIKVDTYSGSGNYFFETKSNIERRTPGCFMYSEADLLFYYFLGTELHMFNLKKARKWFIENQDRFTTCRTSTSVGNGARYHTEGALVKREIFAKEANANLQVVTLGK